MNGESDEKKGEKRRKREKIKTTGKKSLEETRKEGRFCPFWVKESIIEVWRSVPTREKVTHCLATGRNICLKDYKNYSNCEYYQQFKKGDEENRLEGMTMPRYPVNQ